MVNLLQSRRFFDWAFSFTKNDLHLNRFILLVSGMVYPIFGYIYHHLRIESLAMLQMRILMGIAWLAVAVLPYPVLALLGRRQLRQAERAERPVTTSSPRDAPPGPL